MKPEPLAEFPLGNFINHFHNNSVNNYNVTIRAASKSLPICKINVCCQPERDAHGETR